MTIVTGRDVVDVGPGAATGIGVFAGGPRATMGEPRSQWRRHPV
jgi:hypothetical protein